MTKRDITVDLERLIDATSLLHVLTALECICSEKAALMRTAKQEGSTAASWDRASRVIGTAARAESVQTLS